MILRIKFDAELYIVFETSSANVYCVDILLECKWNFNQSNGVFASPYFPDDYHNFQDCQWNITAPKGYVIQLRFGVFELESNPYSCGNGRCSCDYVEVKEESVTGDEIGRAHV